MTLPRTALVSLSDTPWYLQHKLLITVAPDGYLKRVS